MGFQQTAMQFLKILSIIAGLTLIGYAAYNIATFESGDDLIFLLMNIYYILSALLIILIEFRINWVKSNFYGFYKFKGRGIFLALAGILCIQKKDPNNFQEIFGYVLFASLACIGFCYFFFFCGTSDPEGLEDSERRQSQLTEQEEKKASLVNK